MTNESPQTHLQEFLPSQAPDVLDDRRYFDRRHGLRYAAYCLHRLACGIGYDLSQPAGHPSSSVIHLSPPLRISGADSQDLRRSNRHVCELVSRSAISSTSPATFTPATGPSSSGPSTSRATRLSTVHRCSSTGRIWMN